jgi:hypothetical protein
MRFDITKKIDLSYIGDDWKDCYIEFSLPSYGDLKGFTNDEGTDQEKLGKGLEQVKGLFRKGCAISDGKKVEISKDDLVDMPIEILTKCFQAISGQIDPK